MTARSGGALAVSAAGAHRVIRLGLADIAGQVRLKTPGETDARATTNGRRANGNGGRNGSGKARPRKAPEGDLVMTKKQVVIAVVSVIAIVASLAFMVSRVRGRDARNAEAIMASRVLVCQVCGHVYQIGANPTPDQLPKNLQPQGGGQYVGDCARCGNPGATFLLEYRSDKAK